MKGIFNISKRFRSFFFSMIAILFVFGVSISIAYGEWLFDPEITNTDVDNYEIQPTFNADPIRENTILNDGHDVYDAGAVYYDVYFMAQYVPYSRFLTSIGTIQDTVSSGSTTTVQRTNYQFNTSVTPTFYQNSRFEAGYNDELLYGFFDDANGNILTDNTSQYFNRYFKRVNNLAEVTTSVNDTIGNPTNYIVDQQAIGGSTTYDRYFPLQFVTWVVDDTQNLPIYGSNNYTAVPTNPDSLSATESAGANVYAPFEDTHSSYFSGDRYYVRTWYPGRNRGVTVFYQNTLLDDYREYSVFINGRRSLFVYPLYSSDAKNYFETNNRVDGLHITDDTSDDGKASIKVKIPCLDNSLSSALTTNTNISVYRFDNAVFERNAEGNIVYTANDGRQYTSLFIRNDMNRTTGGWQGSAPGRNIQTYDLMGNQFTGRYNIYIIVKASASFTDSEITTINTTLGTTYNIGRYYSIYSSNSSDGLTYSSGSNSRAYYVYYERVYDPRLIGGPTNSIDYTAQSVIERQFIRRGSSGQAKDRYRLRNVRLASTSTISYDLSYTTSQTSYKLEFPSNYFGVMLTPEKTLTYDYQLISNEESYSGYRPEMVINNNLSYFTSSELFETASDANYEGIVIKEYDASGVETGNTFTLNEYQAQVDNNFKPSDFVLLRPKIEGNYTIEVEIDYEADSNGYVTPSTITFWGYRFVNIFVNVVTDGDNGTLQYGYQDYAGDSSSGLTENNNFVNTDSYTYRRDGYSDGDYASLTDEFNDGTTFETILASNNLEDLVTGKIYTSGNINELYIDRNYVLILRDK